MDWTTWHGGGMWILWGVVVLAGTKEVIMKLLKAFIRTSKVDDVIRALEAAACPGITVSRVHGVGYGYDPMLFTLSPSEYRRTLEVTKVEVVCLDEDADRLLLALTGAARTGSQGDGIVFVTPVERAIKVRTGEEGQAAIDRCVSA